MAGKKRPEAGTGPVEAPTAGPVRTLWVEQSYLDFNDNVPANRGPLGPILVAEEGAELRRAFRVEGDGHFVICYEHDKAPQVYLETTADLMVREEPMDDPMGEEAP